MINSIVISGIVGIMMLVLLLMILAIIKTIAACTRAAEPDDPSDPEPTADDFEPGRKPRCRPWRDETDFPESWTSR